MSIIRAFRRRKPVEERRVSALAMPLFPHLTPPDIEAALKWVSQRFTDCLDQPEGSEGTYTIAIPGGQIGVTHVSAPVPSGDLEGPIALAWHWPSASSAVYGHLAHQICFASSSTLDTIDLRLLHSRIVAALMATGGATAVYVGSALLVREADPYIAEIEEATREHLPLLSWVGFNPVDDDQGRSAYTTGLRDFGLLELEARMSGRDWSELLEFLANIAHYELVTGVQIGDGETVGASESERIAVRHTESRFIPETRVAYLEEA